MTIRTDADIRRLREQGALTTAEETLIRDCRAGETTLLRDSEVPDGLNEARTIRADLLGYLICAIVGDRSPAAPQLFRLAA